MKLLHSINYTILPYFLTTAAVYFVKFPAAYTDFIHSAKLEKKKDPQIVVYKNFKMLGNLLRYMHTKIWTGVFEENGFCWEVKCKHFEQHAIISFEYIDYVFFSY